MSDYFPEEFSEENRFKGIPVGPARGKIADLLAKREDLVCDLCLLDEEVQLIMNFARELEEVRKAIKECSAESALTGEVYLARLYPFVPELAEQEKSDEQP